MRGKYRINTTRVTIIERRQAENTGKKRCAGRQREFSNLIITEASLSGKFHVMPSGGWFGNATRRHFYGRLYRCRYPENERADRLVPEPSPALHSATVIISPPRS